LALVEIEQLLDSLEYRPDGSHVNKKKVVGDLNRHPTKADAKLAIANFRAEINAQQERLFDSKMTVAEAWRHFQVHELRDPEVGRSLSTIQGYLNYFKCQILPKWKNVPLDDVKSVAMEKWLRSLDLAPGSKAKIRNHLSALFSHAIRHELYGQINPIKAVRQSAVRLRDPDVLTLDEMKSILSRIESTAIRLMVVIAATTGLRRSEIRGLRWSDLDFEQRWIKLQRGFVREGETTLKTKASRKGVPLTDELAVAFQKWRAETPYPTGGDWIFASPFTDGKRPYWCDAALQDHIKPAVAAAKIEKRVGWHTFRHSLATLLGNQGESVKVVQELLRHANSRITLDVYQQADAGDKRSALEHVKGLFLVEEQKAS
jgi:integrase